MWISFILISKQCTIMNNIWLALQKLKGILSLSENWIEFSEGNCLQRVFLSEYQE